MLASKYLKENYDIYLFWTKRGRVMYDVILHFGYDQLCTVTFLLFCILSYISLLYFYIYKHPNNHDENLALFQEWILAKVYHLKLRVL